MTDENGPPVEMAPKTTDISAKTDVAADVNSEPAKASTKLAETANTASDHIQASTPISVPETDRLESPKPRFKTNTVNMKFRTSAPAAETLTSPALSAQTSSRQTVSKLTLPNKKASADNNSDESRSRSASVEPKSTETVSLTSETSGNRPASSDRESSTELNASAEASTNADASVTDVSKSSGLNLSPENGSGAEHHAKHDYTEEELSNKGISVAGRFHSASNVNWEDEEEEWQPQASMPLPSFGTSAVVSNMKARKSPMRFDSSTIAASSVAEDMASKPRAATLVASTSSDSQKLLISAKNSTPPTDSDGKSEGETAWGARKQTVAPSSLADRIREAKSAQDPPKIVQKARMAVNSHHSAASTGGNGDALNRFRIRASPAVGNGFGRGPPPLNPRRLAVDDDEPRAFHMAGDAHPTADVNFDFGRRGPPPSSDNFDFSRRLAPSDGSAAAPAPFSRGNLPPHRPIPARFLKPTVGGTAGASPSVRASSTVTNTSGAGASASADHSGLELPARNAERKPSVNANSHGQENDNESATQTEIERQGDGAVNTISADSSAPADASKPVKVSSGNGSWQEQKAAIAPAVDIKEIQKKEMVDRLAALKARQEQRQREEEEKKRRIEEKLEQMRQEKLKQEEEEKERIAAAEAAKQAQKEAERERRTKEAEERAKRVAERAAQRAAERAAEMAAKQSEKLATRSDTEPNDSSIPTNASRVNDIESVSTPVVNEWEAEKERRRLLREESTHHNEPLRLTKLAKFPKSEKSTKNTKSEPRAGRVVKLPNTIECSGAFDVQAILRLKSSALPKTKTVPRAFESSVRVCLPTSEGKPTAPTLVHMRSNKSFKHKRNEAARA